MSGLFYSSFISFLIIYLLNGINIVCFIDLIMMLIVSCDLTLVMEN